MGACGPVKGPSGLPSSCSPVTAATDLLEPEGPGCPISHPLINGAPEVRGIAQPSVWSLGTPGFYILGFFNKYLFSHLLTLWVFRFQPQVLSILLSSLLIDTASVAL